MMLCGLTENSLRLKSVKKEGNELPKTARQIKGGQARHTHGG